MSPEYFARENCVAFKVAALGQKVASTYSCRLHERVDGLLSDWQGGRLDCCEICVLQLICLHVQR